MYKLYRKIYRATSLYERLQMPARYICTEMSYTNYFILILKKNNKTAKLRFSRHIRLFSFSTPLEVNQALTASPV